MKEAIVLFAHGSSDPEWARPFERLAALLSGEHAVALAYLEGTRPTLDDAVTALASRGVRSIRVVPVFLGQGGHVKRDLPKLVAAAGARHPGVSLRLEAAIGEQPRVIEAIAALIAAGSPSPRGSGRRP